MCGIAGVIRKNEILPGDVERGRRMAELIRHRGPDDEGSRIGRRYCFNHRRLSIIDLEHGHQPMCNETASVWLIYNGEIYNYGSLRKELLALGHVFKTECDTEVLVHLYEEEGDACVERLNGMFAFAIFDEDRNHLLLARDRAGIKPLYYSINGDCVAFASEAKALVASAGTAPTPDPRSVIDFFALSIVQDGRSSFSGISSLKPAHILSWDLDNPPVTKRFWRPRYGQKTTLQGEQLTSAVSDLLTDAVKMHLISDVPLGTYLSGGLDSSLVSAIAKGYLPDLNTFAAGFTGNEKLDERHFAREAAEMIGSHHHEVEVGPDHFLSNLQKIVWHMDEPTLSPGVYPYYFLCGLVAGSVKVVLGGQGSDELFGGYPRYRMGLLEKDIGKNLRSGRVLRLAGMLAEYRSRYGAGGLKNELRRLFSSDERRIYEIVSGFHPRRLPRLFSAELRRQADGYDPFEPFSSSLRQCDSDDLIDMMLFNDYHNMLPSILRTEDRMSMAHSIESRVPFLDHRLVELAASIAPREKVSGDDPKLILKRVARGQVPESIINRRKQGFTAPVESWFQGRLGQDVKDVLLSDRTLSRGLLAPEYACTVVGRFFNQGKDLWRVWSLLVFEMWCRAYLDGEGPNDSF